MRAAGSTGAPPKLQQAQQNLSLSFDDAQGLRPTAIVAIGDKRITASIPTKCNMVQIGPETLEVRGPSLITGGATLSFGKNGPLDVGSGNIIYLESGSGTFRSADIGRALTKLDDVSHAANNSPRP